MKKPRASAQSGSSSLQRLLSQPTIRGKGGSAVVMCYEFSRIRSGWKRLLLCASLRLCNFAFGSLLHAVSERLSADQSNESRGNVTEGLINIASVPGATFVPLSDAPRLI